MLHQTREVPIGRLIQKDKLRILLDRPCDQDSLPLSLADAVPFHADLGIIPQRQVVNEIPDVDNRDGMNHPFFVDRAHPGGGVSKI